VTVSSAKVVAGAGLDHAVSGHRTRFRVMMSVFAAAARAVRRAARMADKAKRASCAQRSISDVELAVLELFVESDGGSWKVAAVNGRLEAPGSRVSHAMLRLTMLRLVETALVRGERIVRLTHRGVDYLNDHGYVRATSPIVPW